MSESPKKIWTDPLFWYPVGGTYTHNGVEIQKTPYIRADIVDELVEALKFAWPIIEHERYKWEGSYGKNFDSAKADRARQACKKARSALAKLEESSVREETPD